MTKIREIKDLINTHLDNGVLVLSEIYDAIQADGYHRPSIRYAKAELLKDINTKINRLEKSVETLTT